MTLVSTQNARAAVAAVRRIWTDGRPVERVAYVVGAVLMLSGLVHVGVLLATGGSWSGPVSLRKAATFGLSFGLTLASVAWASSYVRVSPRVRAGLLGVFTVACVVETVLVSMQAWRGVPSHFNFETPFDTTVAMTLAGGGGVIIATMLGFTGAALRSGTISDASMRFSVRFGFVSLIAALVTGAAMIAMGVVQVQTGNPDGAYTTAGALKPLHAVTMHAILVLPGLAWLLNFTGWPEDRRLRLVQAAGAGYLVLIAVAAVISL